jgi:hypothetical protein
MRAFLVLHRRSGDVLIKGTISCDGTVSAEFISDQLDGQHVERILETIRVDVAEGYGGGQLTYQCLEWHELRGQRQEIGQS